MCGHASRALLVCLGADVGHGQSSSGTPLAQLTLAETGVELISSPHSPSWRGGGDKGLFPNATAGGGPGGDFEPTLAICSAWEKLWRGCPEKQKADWGLLCSPLGGKSHNYRGSESTSGEGEKRGDKKGKKNILWSQRCRSSRTGSTKFGIIKGLGGGETLTIHEWFVLKEKHMNKANLLKHSPHK